MTDNELYGLAIFPIINVGLVADGFTGVNVLQAYQPTQQGVPTSSSVFISKSGDHLYGWVKRSAVWDSLGSVEILTETQMIESTFHVEALSIQDPLTPLAYTASDLANEVAAILRSQEALDALRILEIGILRITDVENPNFKDDRDQFEAAPSFNFVLTHRRTRIRNIPVIESTQSVFARV